MESGLIPRGHAPRGFLRVGFAAGENRLPAGCGFCAARTAFPWGKVSPQATDEGQTRDQCRCARLPALLQAARRGAFLSLREERNQRRARGDLPNGPPLTLPARPRRGLRAPPLDPPRGLREFYERREKLRLNTPAFGRLTSQISTLFLLCKAPVPRPSEGGSNGGNRLSCS